MLGSEYIFENFNTIKSLIYNNINLDLFNYISLVNNN